MGEVVGEVGLEEGLRLVGVVGEVEGEGEGVRWGSRVAHSGG